MHVYRYLYRQRCSSLRSHQARGERDSEKKERGSYMYQRRKENYNTYTMQQNRERLDVERKTKTRERARFLCRFQACFEIYSFLSKTPVYIHMWCRQVCRQIKSTE